MADKSIGELPAAPALYDDSLLVVEQQSQARSVAGRIIKQFARDSVTEYAGNAKESADAAAKSAAAAAGSAAAAATAAQQSNTDVKNAAKSASEAKQSETNAADSAKLSESWAVGGTDKRTGENENNSKYWADRAQTYAEQAKTPAENVYSVILTDSITAEKYALVVDNGRLALLGVSNDLDSAEIALVDQNTGMAYNVIVESGKLKIQEVV